MVCYGFVVVVTLYRPGPAYKLYDSNNLQCHLGSLCDHIINVMLLYVIIWDYNGLYYANYCKAISDAVNQMVTFKWWSKYK